jgi:hypothetical protein
MFTVCSVLNNLPWPAMQAVLPGYFLRPFLPPIRRCGSTGWRPRSSAPPNRWQNQYSCVAIARKGCRYFAKKDFNPHVTLLHAERNVEEYPIEPIGWTVNEFVLIHSMHGHVRLARRPLRAPYEDTAMLLPAKTAGDDNSRTFEDAGDVRKNRGGCARGACSAQAKPFGKCELSEKAAGFVLARCCCS